MFVSESLAPLETYIKYIDILKQLAFILHSGNKQNHRITQLITTYFELMILELCWNADIFVEHIQMDETCLVHIELTLVFKIQVILMGREWKDRSTVRSV